ncbi:MAG TPA: sigma-70 family RNA polymerase sigma factor [Gemmataceae bacterium]
MHATTLQGILEHLRRLTTPARDRDLSDADLLERFRLRGEEAAFTLLVQRHGPMVLAVCRRIRGDAHEAEDAFQATFLVLVRNAGAIRKQQSLAGWLYGVASRIAHKARLRSARQRARPFDALPSIIRDDPSAKLTAEELRAALDEEIERLPDKYRIPLVLCYLADKTHEQAAGELGWPKSSVTARLARARELLQRRLRHRGFTAPASLLAALWTEQSAKAAIPTRLTLSTVRLAMQTLTGETLAATNAAALADGFVKGAASAKYTAMLTLLVPMGLAALSMWMVSSPVPSARQKTPPPQALDHRGEKQAPTRKPRVDLFGDPLPDEAVARMGWGRLRHPDCRLAFSTDGKTLISGARNGIRIWDAATGQLRRRFDLDLSSNWTLSFAFTGERIFIAGEGREKRIVTLQVFDPASGKVRRRLELPDQATCANVTLSRDGKWLAYGHQNNIRLHDTASGREVLRLPRGDCIAFAPDGKTIAICDLTGTVQIHDTASGKSVRELKRDGDTVADIAFSPDGRFLASIVWNEKQRETREISIWDIITGEERHRLKGPGGFALCAAFSPDGKYVATGYQHPDLILWDMATGKEVRRYPTDALFASIAFSPDGKSLAAASGEGTIRLWEPETGQVLPGSADPFINGVLALRFSGDGRRLLGNTDMCFVWDAATGRELRRFLRVSQCSCSSALSPDESLLASADRDGTIQLWSAATGEKLRTLKGHEKWVRSLVFAADGRRLFSSSVDGTIRMWDAANGREQRKLTGQGELAVSPDGRSLASDSGSNVVLWDLTTGERKATLVMASRNSPGQKVFSPDSRLLAAVNGGARRNDPGEVKVWDVATGKLRHSFEGHKTRGGSVAFSPDGRMLATGDHNGVLFLWELASGRRRHQFIGHESWIHALAFSPDGRSLAASSVDAPVYIWDVAGILGPKPRRLANEELQRCWNTLAGEDAPAAFQAIRRLIAVPMQTLPYLREHLKPVPAPDLKRVRRLVEMLDSNEFKERQEAAVELEKQADAAASLLRQILTKERPSLELHRRLQQILEGIEAKPETLRTVRTVEVLEWIGTPAAVRLIDELANGAADAPLTREANAAKRRLSR